MTLSLQKHKMILYLNKPCSCANRVGLLCNLQTCNLEVSASNLDADIKLTHVITQLFSVHAIKALYEKYRYSHILFNLGTSKGKRSASRSGRLTLGKWAETTAGLDVLEKIKVSSPLNDSNPRTVQLAAELQLLNKY
jgi:hypothetical protein